MGESGESIVTMVSSRGRLGTVSALLVLLAAAGCGSETTTTDGGPAGGGSPAAVQDQPITARAIAAVALEHVTGVTTSREPTYVDPDDPDTPAGAVGADLRFHGDGEYDGDLVRVYLSPATTKPDCPADSCVAQAVDGGTRYLRWDLVEPEEDPGIIVIDVVLADQTLRVLSAGEEITDDPRDLDLEVPVGVLEQIAADPRLRLLTSADVVAAGEALSDWRG